MHIYFVEDGSPKAQPVCQVAQKVTPADVACPVSIHDKPERDVRSSAKTTWIRNLFLEAILGSGASPP